MVKRGLPFIIIIIIALSATALLSAASAAAQDVPSIPSIRDKTAGMQAIDGYFPMYWDESAGTLWLEISDRHRSAPNRPVAVRCLSVISAAEVPRSLVIPHGRTREVIKRSSPGGEPCRNAYSAGPRRSSSPRPAVAAAQWTMSHKP